MEKLIGADRGRHFGAAIAYSGDRLLVGAPRTPVANGTGQNAGAAYVLVKEGEYWRTEAELTASDAAEGDFFGSAVVISGDMAIVGAPEEGTDGAVYVFEYREQTARWVRAIKLEAAPGRRTPSFGRSLAYERDVLVVGGVGAFHTFRRTDTGWRTMETTVASDGAFSDDFGASLALSQGTLVVGAPAWDGSHSDQGAVYIFQYIGPSWSELERVTAPKPVTPSDRFGAAVAVDGDTILIGAPGFDSQLPIDRDDGAVFVLRRSDGAWALEATLTVPSPFRIDDGEKGYQLGRHLAILGDAAIVGHGVTAGSDRPSVAHVYERDRGQWGETGTLTLLDRPSVDGVEALLLTRDAIVLGSPRVTNYNTSRGAVYLCDLAEQGLRGCTDDPESEPEVEVLIEMSRVDELTGKIPTGKRIAMSGQRFLVVGPQAVEVYLAEANRWRLEATLFTHGADTQSVTGVALHHDQAIVVTSRDIRSYAFDGAWDLDDVFGQEHALPLALGGNIHIALHEDVLAISSPIEVLVFERTAASWEEAEIEWLEGRIPVAGGPVSVSGSIMLAARTAYDRVYVFHRRGDSWVQDGELTGGPGFGARLAASGTRAAITKGEEVQMYRRRDGKWKQTDTVCGPAGADQGFGYSLAMVGSRLLVGAPFALGAEGQSGAGFMFVREGETWRLRQKLLSSDVQRFDELGHFVALLDDRAVVQAPAHEIAGGRGELYEFELSPIGNSGGLGCSAGLGGRSSWLGMLLVVVACGRLRPLRKSSHNMGTMRTKSHKCATLSDRIGSTESRHTPCTTADHYGYLSTKHPSRRPPLWSSRMRSGLDDDTKHKRRLLL